MVKRKLYLIEALLILAIISLTMADNPGTRKSLTILTQTTTLTKKE